MTTTPPSRGLHAGNLVRTGALAAGIAAGLFVVSARARNAEPQAATGGTAMVVADQHIAAEVGRDVLAGGGNAIDAAVAMGYALAVVEPCCGNLGGGGFMLIHLADGRDRFINFCERAPLKATPGMYLDASGNVVSGRSTRGYLAVAVPGTVAGLEKARESYGTRPRAALIAPAIALAAQGYVLVDGDLATNHQAAALFLAQASFAGQPNVAAIFLNSNGQPYQVGDRMVQTDLERTLTQIAESGPDAFYKGPIAKAIVAASDANGGILSEQDFAQYSVTEETPVSCHYRGYHVVSAPPPSSGGTVICEILNVLSAYPLDQYGRGSVQAVHNTIEAERHAYADRNAYLGDPDFVDNPLQALLSARYADAIRSAIDPVRATPSAAVTPGLGGLAVATQEGEHTTHYSILDRWGNAVAVTYTINSYFGAGVIAGDTGFFLNNEMDDFTAKPGTANQFGLVQGAANVIAPGKRPLSSMSPTLLENNAGQVRMVVGAPGGARIPTAVLGVIQNVVDYGMSLADAVAAPRMHHQFLPDTVYLEPDALAPSVIAALESDGYRFTQPNWTWRLTPRTWGLVEAIELDPATGVIRGASDTRRAGGAALGLP